MAVTTENGQGLAELIAIARAAHLTHDRDMKASAVRRLKEEYGVNISFTKSRSHKGEVTSCR